MDDFDKSKRKEKPKGGYRVNWLFVNIGTLVVVGVLAALFFIMPACGCSPPVDMTLTDQANWRMTTTARFIIEVTASQPTRTHTPLARTQAAMTAIALTTDTTAGGGLAMITPAASPSATGANCFFTWRTKVDEAATAQLQAELDKLELAGLTGRVTAYGEDYVCGGASQPARFAAMDRSVMLAVPVASLTDHALLGAAIEQLLRAIELVKFDKPREIVMDFSAGGSDTLRWRLAYADAFAALQSGTQGAALFNLGK